MPDMRVPRNFPCHVEPILDEPPDVVDAIAGIAATALAEAARLRIQLMAARQRNIELLAELDTLRSLIRASHAHF